MPNEYILFHRNGGWYTKTSQLHSDYRVAQVFDREDALDMCKLHEGKLLPVERAFYAETVKK